MMQRILATVWALLFIGCTSHQVELTDDYLKSVRDMPMAAPAFTPPVIEPFYLSNGVKVYFAPDDEVPLFSCSLLFPRGTLDRVAEESVQYAALDSVMRTGGVEGLSSDEFDLALQALSATVNVSVGSEVSSLSFGGLVGDFTSIASLAKRVWLTPTFNEDRLHLWKLQMAEAISRRKESPESIVATAFTQILYRGSLLGNPITRRQVERLQRGDLMHLHKKIFNPSGMVILLSGPLQKEQVKEMLEQMLHDNGTQMPFTGVASQNDIPPLMTARNLEQIRTVPGIYFIEKHFQQASVYVGLLGPKRFTPDYPVLDVFNGIFGANGEFSSLLVKEVRSRLGLSYAVMGGVFRDEPVGRSFIGLQTKNESVAQALRASFETLQAIQQGRFSDQLTNDVKTALASSYVFGFDSLHAVAGRRVFQDLLGYPPDFDQTYLPKISAVTGEEIQDIVRKYWDLQKAVIIVVGDKQARRSLQEGKAKRWLPNLPIKEVTFDEQLTGL